MNYSTNSEGSVDGIDEIDRMLKSLLEEQCIHDYTSQKTALQKGSGYTGAVSTIDVTGKDDKNNTKTLNVVVKSTRMMESVETIPRLYAREIYMYSKVFPAFSKLQTEKGLPQSIFTAKLYKTHVDGERSILMLQNLKTIGYSLYDRKKRMDENHVRAVMTEYGRLHALSYALYHYDPECFTEVFNSSDKLFETFAIDNKFKDGFKNKCTTVKDALDPTTDSKTIRMYQTFLETFDSYFNETIHTEDAHSVILHGDCWTNNILFKYDDEEDKTRPTAVTFIDFQFSRLGSPVLDLSYFFYTCSSQEIVDDYEHYLKIYHNILSTNLKRMGVDVTNAISYSILLEHWKKYAKYGLIFSIIVNYLMLTEPDAQMFEEMKNNNFDIFNYPIANMAEYKKIIRHLILHFASNNFF